MAFVTLDNLSGDESLSWMRESVPVIAASQVSGAGKIVPLRVDSSVDATSANAARLVHGYFDRRRGNLHFEFSIEDAVTHKMRAVTADGDALTAANAIATAIDPGAHAFSSANLRAVEAWGRRDFAGAVELDPDFGSAWRELVQARIGQPEQALAAATQALRRSTLKTPLDRANIELLAARLRRDDAAISKATLELARLLPNDAPLLSSLAEQEAAGRRFASAVKLYTEVIRLEPENTSVHNLLGYAQFFAGDLQAARKSFDEYARDKEQEANAFDSQGEVLFMAGHFKEAEEYFGRAHKANSSMLDGGDLQKAAYARWLAGDLPGADMIFEDYLRFRLDRKDQAVEWRRATWEYATGRSEQAATRLKAVKGPASGIAQSQLVVWNNAARLGQDLASLERAYLAAPASSDGLPRTLYARALFAAGRREEAAKLVELWPLPDSGDPLLQSLLYPLYLDLRKSLGK